MRKLEEHFCTYGQHEKLIELGLNEEEHELSCEYYNLPVTPFAGFLRSQALDFFRDKKMLGEIMAIDDWNVYTYGIWLEDCMSPFFKVETGTGEYITYHEAESALIDKLIELEMEAQNGK